MSRVESRIHSGTRMQRRERRERILTLRFCVVVILAAICLRLFVINTIRVDGPSMERTLYTGELVMVNKLGVRFASPKRYDVVVFRFGDDTKKYIKRVVALAGETVEVREGELLVNGAPLADDIHSWGKRPQDMAALTVPEDSVFVMGDNRANSADSVSKGPVQRAWIEGVAFVVIWPLKDIKLL